jgi:DNA-binding XRE family transcriptional regulator
MGTAKDYRTEWLTRCDPISLAEARKRFGRALRARRLSILVRFRGRPVAEPMRQSALARRLGVSQNTLHGIESGETSPSFPLYVAICRELKLGKIPLVG